MQRLLPDASHVRGQRIKTSFAYRGITCAASLYVPETADGAALPAILMVGGWGSVQEALTPPYVNRFVEAGFAVMEFDYPGWGDSAGWPRQDINPWRRVRVIDAALAHLKNLPQIDERRIVLWGTSFGGGHVVDIAVDHPEVAAAVIQVPMLDGLATVLAVPFLRLLKFGLYGIMDLFKPGSRINVPTLARPGEFGSMDRDGAWEAMTLGLDGLGDKKYDNRVTARSLLTMPFYRPWRRLKRVDVPMLIVGATRDTVAPFVSEKVFNVRNRNLQVIEVNANHFDPYFDPVFSGMIEHQLTFLERVMSKN
jgi:pimeloyl-ACP methyl ester carboxylesterase